MYNSRTLVKFTQYADTKPADFHPEILGQVFNDDNLLILLCNQLSKEEQAQVAASCKRFYDFMHQHYYDTTYGRAVGFIKFMGNELNDVIKNVNNYHEEQNSLFFTFKRMPLYLRLLMTLSIIGCVAVIYYASEIRPMKLVQIMLGMIQMGVGVFIGHKRSVQTSLQSPLDQLSLSSLEEIKDKSPLIKFLLSSENIRSLTQNDMNLFLQRMINDVTWAVSQFENYHKGLIGQAGVPSVELDQVGGEKDQKTLKFLLDKWNEIHPEADKEVKYTSSLSLT
jgi:hypothetical protein